MFPFGSCILEAKVVGKDHFDMVWQNVCSGIMSSRIYAILGMDELLAEIIGE